MERSAGVIRADIEIGGAAAAAAAARTAAAGIEALADANIAFVRTAGTAARAAGTAAEAGAKQVENANAVGRALVRAAEDQARAIEKAASDAAAARERAARDSVKGTTNALRQAQRDRRAAQDGLVFDPSLPADPAAMAAAQRLATEADAAVKAAKEAAQAAKAELADAIREGRRSIAAAKEEGEEKVRLGKRAAEDLIDAERDRRARERSNAKEAISDEKDRAAAIRETGKAAAAAAPSKSLGSKLLSGLDYLPKLGLDTIAKGAASPIAGAVTGAVSAVTGSLFSKGLIPSVFSGLKGLGSIAFSALSSVSGVITGVVGGLTSLAAGVVKAGVAFAVNLGKTVISGLTSIVSWIGQATLGLAGMAVKAGLVAAGLVAAGGAFAQHALGDSADFVINMDNAARSTGLTQEKFTALSVAARRFGVDVNDLRSSMIQFQGQVYAAFQSPDSQLGQYFASIGVTLTDANGKLKTTNDLLEETVRKSAALDESISGPNLALLFGEDDIGKLRPIFDELVKDADYLNKAGNRAAALGAVPTARDRQVLQAYRAAVGDLSDAWTGMKLAIATAVGPSFTYLIKAAADAVATLRGQVAGFFGTGAARMASLLSDFRTLVDGGFEGRNDFLPDVETQKANARKTAAAYGYELRRYINEQGEEVDFIPVKQPVINRWLIPIRNALSYVEYGFRRIKPLATEFFAALFDDAKARKDFPWLVTLKTGVFAAGRLLREAILTLGGDDKLVTEFPWLIALRNGLKSAVTLVKEAFQAINGDDRFVTQFPWLLKVRDGVTAVYGYLKRLGSEIYMAVFGDDTGQSYTFKWIPVAKQYLQAFVDYVKLVWADLGRIWQGGEAQTTVGSWVQRLGVALVAGKDMIVGFVQTVGLVWEDLKRVFAGDIGPAKTFNFQGINEAATGAIRLISDLKKAFSGDTGEEATFNFPFIQSAARWVSFLGDVLNGVLTVAGKLRDVVVSVVKGATLGLVDLSDAKTIGGIIGVALALSTAAKAWRILGKAIGFVRGLLGGGAAAGAAAAVEGGAASAAAGAAGTAVAGVAEGAVVGGVGAALAGVGAAAAKSGEGAAKAVPLFTRLIDKFKALIALAGRFPGIARFLGLTIATTAGGMLMDAGEGGTTEGLLANVAGGALSGGGTALMLSRNPYVAAAGLIGGGLYGYNSYLDKTNALQLAAKRKELGLGPAAAAGEGVDAEQAQLDAELADLKTGFTNAAEAAGLAFRGIGWKGIGDKAGDEIGMGVENAVTRRFSDLFAGRGVDAGGSLGGGLSSLASSTGARSVVVPTGFVDPFTGYVAGSQTDQTQSNRAGNTLVVNLANGGELRARQTNDEYAASRAAIARGN